MKPTHLKVVYLVGPSLSDHMIKVVKVIPREGYKLWLTFSDGVEGVADLSDLAERGVTRDWSDRSVFSSVSITDAGALEWPGNVDICADALYMRVTGKKPEEVFESLAERANA